MKPQDTAPLLTAMGPTTLLTPPIAILGVLIGVAVLWLLADEKDKDKSKADAQSQRKEPLELGEPDADMPPLPARNPSAKRVMREDLAEALAYGERRFTRKEAAAALEALGFSRSAAYKALSRDGKFADLLEFTPDGLIEWKG